MRAGVSAFADDVRTHRYPAVQHTYAMAADELARFRALFAEAAPGSATRGG
jgi:hypothetical protein